MMDYRISRFVRTTYRSILLTGSSQLIASRNQDRVGIEIYYNPDSSDLPFTGFFVYVGIDKDADSTDLSLQAYGQPLKWSFAEDGDTPQRQFTAIDNNNNKGFLQVIERWLPESILKAEIERM